MMARRFWLGLPLLLAGVSVLVALPASGKGRKQKQLAQLFTSSGRCTACHNALVTTDGQDVSIGTDWGASMMGNSARDPYWQAAVRRETMEHPTASAAIQDECSKCHMPMARFLAHEMGGRGEVFANLPIGQAQTLANAPNAALAADGVACSLCHQISSENLGTEASFVGGFAIDTRQGRGGRPVFGPYDVDRGRSRVMRSSSGFVPSKGDHIRQSELCATCHTLYTHSLGPQGDVVGELPEQVPYLEWKHSEYPGQQRSCQSCHLQPFPRPTSISSVLPQPRDGMAPHVFRGGNAFMMNLLNRYRQELGVTALPIDLANTARRTAEHLARETARIALRTRPGSPGSLAIDVAVENLAGHKFPTAYPSRRAWIHLRVVDAKARLVFESGALGADGAIAGNDNDADPRRFEPHHQVVERADQVQIYEPILGDPRGRVTTGLLTATQYLKDNRVLPRGFDKSTAHADVAVYGAAIADPDFVGGVDHTVYVVQVEDFAAPFTIEASLWYQSIGHRWAMNLKAFSAAEPQRFVRYYESMADVSGVRIASATARVPAVERWIGRQP